MVEHDADALCAARSTHDAARRRIAGAIIVIERGKARKAREGRGVCRSGEPRAPQLCLHPPPDKVVRLKEYPHAYDEIGILIPKRQGDRVFYSFAVWR